MISKPKLALAIALATGSWNALSGPLADAVNALGLGSLLTDTTTTLTDGLGSALSSLGGSSLADADIISPANGDGALDADVISSSTLLGLQPVDSSMLDPNQTINTGILFPAGAGGSAVAPLNGALQGLVGSEGVITGIVQTLGDNLQDAVTPLTDALASSGLGDAAGSLDAVNLSVGTLDIGTNNENTVLDVDLLNTDTGSQGDIGLALISDGASGTGETAGISIIGGDGSGTGGIAGLSVIGGEGSGSSDLIGAAVIAGDDSGTGALAGAGVLTGDNSGVSDTIGAGIISGDNSGSGDLIGAAVIAGENSGTSDLIGAAALSGDGSGQGGLVDAGLLGGDSSGDNGIISINAVTGLAALPGGDGNGNINNPGVDGGDDDGQLGDLPLVFDHTDAARYALSCSGPDSDGDGVCDKDDRCPNTPKGAAVLSSGCHLGGDSPLILHGVHFAFDSSQLTRASAAELYHAIQVLKQNPGMVIEVAGHTDDRGSDHYNDRLSVARANAVYEVLVNNGVDPDRLKIKGYGRGQPVAPNTTSDGHWDLSGMAENRRVEFRLDNTQVSTAAN